MTIVRTEVVDVTFQKEEKHFGLIEKKRLEKLGFIDQGEDSYNGKIHMQFIRMTDVTPEKYD